MTDSLQAEKTEDVSKQKGGIAKAKEDIPLSKEEVEALKRERDDAVRKLSETSEAKVELEQRVADLEERRSLVDTGPDLNLAWWSEFSLWELRQATRNFSDATKVGEAGFGCVYRGVLRNTAVAIKMLHSQSSSQFQQEVN